MPSDYDGHLPSVVLAVEAELAGPDDVGFAEGPEQFAGTLAVVSFVPEKGPERETSYGRTNSCSGCRTVSTGQGAVRTTRSATLPISM
jgi:hypothetical protein